MRNVIYILQGIRVLSTNQMIVHLIKGVKTQRRNEIHLILLHAVEKLQMHTTTFLIFNTCSYIIRLNVWHRQRRHFPRGKASWIKLQLCQ